MRDVAGRKTELGRAEVGLGWLARGPTGRPDHLFLRGFELPFIQSKEHQTLSAYPLVIR
jgi:hypothetical protein